MLLLDRNLALYFVGASDFIGLGFDRRFLGVGMNRTLQGDDSVLTDDLDVVSIRGQRFIGHHGLPNFLRQFAILTIHLLLIGGDSSRVPISFVRFCVVRLRACILRQRPNRRGPRCTKQKRRNNCESLDG